MNKHNFDHLIENIAKKHFIGIQTLNVDNKNHINFHNVDVMTIKAALEEAYFTGQKSGMRPDGSVYQD